MNRLPFIFFAVLSTVSCGASAALPSGGTTSTYTAADGSSWRYHKFTSNGTFSTNGYSGPFDYIIVGGGGAGGWGTGLPGGGGGGAGEYIARSSQTLAAGSYSVSVGQGGSTTCSVSGSGLSVTVSYSSSNGADSSFAGLTAIGGGAGGAPSNGSSGGSGGGGGNNSTGGASSAVTGLGNPGGRGYRYSSGDRVYQTTGGGGGAGSVGGNGTRSTAEKAGDGGDGISSLITGLPVIYAAGGGGSAYGGEGQGGSNGVGGDGTDIDGLYSAAAATDPDAFTGSGGGGGTVLSNNCDIGPPSEGASGVVIVAYKLPPKVSNVTSSKSDGHYGEGEAISIEVVFDQEITVAGSPTLTLETGATDQTLNYTGIDASGKILTFDYSVQAGDTSADLDYSGVAALALNGGSITSTANSSDATIDLPSPGATGSLSANKAIVIDTTDPVATDANISISGGSGTGGAFKIGDTVTASWDTSGSDGDTNITASLGTVTVDFSAFGGGPAVAASLSGSTWTATYTIVAGSIDLSNLNVSVTATDEAGNFTTTADTTNATVDNQAPTITAGNISVIGATGTGGAFMIGDTVTATWDNTASGDNNADINSVAFDLSQFGGGAAVAGTNSSGTWTATYTIVADGIDATNRNITVTAVDDAGNSKGPVSGTDNETVDNQSPSVPGASITVSGASGTGGAFIIGDTVVVSFDPASNSDTISSVTADLSGFGGGSAVVATYNSSTSKWEASYTLVEGSLDSNAVTVSVTATDNAGNTLSEVSTTVSTVNTLAPSVVITGPTGNVTGPFEISIEFDATVTGLTTDTATDFRIENGTLASVSGSGQSYTAMIDPVLGQMILIQIKSGAATNTSGNPNAESNEFTVEAGSPASEFEKHKVEIENTIINEVQRTLIASMDTNRSISKSARQRFMQAKLQSANCGVDNQDESGNSQDTSCQQGMSSGDELAKPAPITAYGDDNGFDAQGGFATSEVNTEEQSRRLIWGDYTVIKDSLGNTSGHATIKAAFENQHSESLMLGYYLSADVGRANLEGNFTGLQDSLGLTAGVYAVKQLSGQIFLDSSIGLERRKNDLELDNGTLSLDSQYYTNSALFDAAVTGVYQGQGFEIWPEAALAYGRTKIGNIRFTGRAYGLVDDQLYLNAGKVTLANVTLTPEVKIPLDNQPVSSSDSVLSIAPRLICQQIRSTVNSKDCGKGIELGLSQYWLDRAGTFNINFKRDLVGDVNQNSLSLNVEWHF